MFYIANADFLSWSNLESAVMLILLDGALVHRR